MHQIWRNSCDLACWWTSLWLFWLPVPFPCSSLRLHLTNTHTQENFSFDPTAQHKLAFLFPCTLLLAKTSYLKPLVRPCVVLQLQRKERNSKCVCLLSNKMYVSNLMQMMRPYMRAFWPVCDKMDEVNGNAMRRTTGQKDFTSHSVGRGRLQRTNALLSEWVDHSSPVSPYLIPNPTMHGRMNEPGFVVVFFPMCMQHTGSEIKLFHMTMCSFHLSNHSVLH